MSFRLAYSYGIDGDRAQASGEITVDAALDEHALKSAFVHAVHEAFGRLWQQVKPKEDG
jgi:hypothetical protein